MNELPDLPFKKVLSYLSLEDLIKSRAVCRSWYHRINCVRVKCLCFSEHRRGVISEKDRLAVFAQNFVSTQRFASFFTNFGPTILSNLKHLRLCDLELDEKNRAEFARTLSSISQLEELDIIWFGYSSTGLELKMKLFLNLPMLHSIQLERVLAIKRLTLMAPSLKRIKLMDCYKLRVDLLYAKPVERLLVDNLEYTPVKNLTNLRYLYKGDDPKKYLDRISRIHPSILSSLKHLKELHLDDLDDRERISAFFRQKQLSNRTQLKIYVLGLLLSGPDDPAISSLRRDFNERTLLRLAANSSRLADEIPLRRHLVYSLIELLAPNSEMNVLRKFTDLKELIVDHRVQDSQRFLNLLKNLDNVVNLKFTSDQPQDLFDRLPEHCAVQRLTIERELSDVRFIFRLKDIIYLKLPCSIDDKTVWKISELPLLSYFFFRYNDQSISIETVHSKRFRISIGHSQIIAATIRAAVLHMLYMVPNP